MGIQKEPIDILSEGTDKTGLNIGIISHISGDH